MTASSVQPVVLRNGVDVEDPLGVVLGFLEGYPHLDVGDSSRAASFGEVDLRLANRGGARISAAEIAAILERRRSIELALQTIAPDTSLARAANSVPWLVLKQLFDAFADIRGVGFSKMTKALYPKRPALVPMLDSVVQKYLEDDDLGARLLSGTAPSSSYAATNAISTVTVVPSGRSGGRSPDVATRSLRCGSSTRRFGVPVERSGIR